MSARLTGAILVIAIAAFVAGRMTGHRSPARDQTAAPAAAAPVKSQLWTCSMHPQIKLPKPGKCPICSMDLIPLTTEYKEAHGVRELSISESAAKLMEVETAPVERRFVTAAVRMVGKIDYDETRVSYITAWVPGRLDRLFVDYTGLPVKTGDHMVYLYSPELLSAQEELLQAIATAKQLERSDVPVVRQTTEATVTAAREKLRLWGLTPEQIKEIEQRGKPSDHMTIYAPRGGIVVHKNAQEGMYVNMGTRIYTIADLSRVWVSLDAYESDLAWLRYGQPVRFTTESYPGEVFTGSISFIHPVLDEATRTVKVRVNVPNADGRLKPGMFVRAEAEARLATGARVMDVSLAGKWICPMHPEVVKDAPGDCDECGMPLVRAESLGYVEREPTDADMPLVIPATAALLTGTRAVVYVQLPDKDSPTFEGRQVRLGPRAGDDYIVKSGLAEGERVVTKGNFKLDAELQIRARPSMMTPGDDARTEPAAHASGTDAGAGVSEPTAALDPAFKTQLRDVAAAYLGIQSALAGDSLTNAVSAAGRTLEALAAVDMERVSGRNHTDWMNARSELKHPLTRLAEATSIAAARKEFALVSESLAALVVRFHPMDKPLYRLRCPMAFDGRGANWLQDAQDVHNPYFGSAMPACGAVEEELR